MKPVWSIPCTINCVNTVVETDTAVVHSSAASSLITINGIGMLLHPSEHDILYQSIGAACGSVSMETGPVAVTHGMVTHSMYIFAWSANIVRCGY